jgi:hypothetical protein
VLIVLMSRVELPQVVFWRWSLKTGRHYQSTSPTMQVHICNIVLSKASMKAFFRKALLSLF